MTDHSISGMISVIKIVIETLNIIKFLHLEISIKIDSFLQKWPSLYRNRNDRNYSNCGMISVIEILIETLNIKFLHLKIGIEIDLFRQK